MSVYTRASTTARPPSSISANAQLLLLLFVPPCFRRSVVLTSGPTIPYKIDGTDLYLETNYSAKNVLENVHGLMALFGYQPTDFGYETQND